MEAVGFVEGTRKTISALRAAMALMLGHPLPEPPPEPEPAVQACPQCEAAMVFDERLSLKQWIERVAGQTAPRGPP